MFGTPDPAALGPPEEIERLFRDLAAKSRAGHVDLRYSPGRGIWSILMPSGNDMRVVPGSLSRTPAEALRETIRRWDARSPEAPFFH